MNSEIEGLHEIHITTDPRDLFAMRMYCLDNKLKPILAVAAYGNSPIQPMFSKFKNGTATEVISRAKEMARTMTEDYGIRVTRVKVEAMMHNKGVPSEARVGVAGNPIDSINDMTDNKPADDHKQHYFEFHLKMDVADSKEWQRLADVCYEKNAHLSFNAFKKETVPLITLRLPGAIGSTKAVQMKDKLMDHLKTNGFHSNSGIQSEYSVYDSNVGLDAGWL